MNTTTKFETDFNVRILLTTLELQAILGCGRASAVKIGTDAAARIDIGKRVLWHREKIQSYLASISV